MNIEAFLLCDAATEQQGKLNILGAFDNIYTRKMPTQHRVCSFAARLRFDKIEAGNHTVQIQIIDYDGRSIGPKLEGKLCVQVADDADSSVVNLVLSIHGLKFERYGIYRIDLAIDGDIKASLPLRVREVPSRTQ